MLKLKLLNETEKKVVFAYYPEAKEEYGILEINKCDGNIEIMSLAENDEFRTYMHKAVSQMMKYYKENVYQKEVTVAWY